MNPSSTLERIAALTQNPKIKELSLQLAREFEDQHNRQNNQFAIVVGRLENRIRELEDTIADLETQIRALYRQLKSDGGNGDRTRAVGE